MIWRWLGERRYWTIYYAVYLLVGLVLMLLDWPGKNKQEWAAILTVSAGVALTVAALVEIGVRAMLLIPATIRKIRQDKGREDRRKVDEVLAQHPELSETVKQQIRDALKDQET